MQRRIVVSSLTSLLLVSSVAFAQPAAPKPPKPPAAPPAQEPAAPQPPAKIVVNDPMLAPVPPAGRVLNNWKEALGYITSRSIDVATAYQEILRAEALRRNALAGALGTINANGTVSGQILTGSAQTVTVDASGKPSIVTTSLPSQNPLVTGNVSANIVLSPRVWYSVGTADMSVASAKLGYDDKRRTVLTTVANAIVAVITSERVAEINRNGLKSALERLDLTQRKFRLGDATRLDVLRAEQDAATARSTLVSGDESLRQTREALGLALGYHESFGVPPGISLNEIETTVGGVCAAGKLDDRADIRQAKNDLEVAKRGITDAWLMYSPFITVSSVLSVSSNAQAQADGKTGAWSIQGVLTIPLWDGGARYAQMKTAKVNAEEAKLKLEATLRTANIQVAQALRGVAVAEQARGVSLTTRDLARESARLAQRAYEVGTGTSFDLVDTAKAERSAELDLAVKDFNVISARLSAMLAAANCTY
jgi:outer membrane protein TolC